MSTTIDQRVVEMRFDNKQFESGVSTTMSTLDKLKQKLHLDGASKGLENIDTAAKKINFGSLGNAVESIHAKFSALEVMGVTALANITNSAVNTGKRLVSALTIDPVRTGFNEYELKMNSVKTIMASTGESLETVNKYLNELNTYSDQTIYSFSDMTQNIGKFTNAGVKLEDAVLAIKGISNEAAVSGANANEASRAMYNFAQALSVGYIQRIDWKSIELANMATVEFKEQLLDAAIAAGTVTKNSEGLYSTLAHPDEAYNAAAMFTETLSDQWLTTEALINTLKDYADETTEIGAKATEAATQVKTVTQLWDTLKESAQSGWAQTWELLIGDLEQATKLLTKVSEAVGGVIGKMSDWRNSLLAGALTSKWEQFAEKIEEAGISTDTFLSKLEEVAEENGIVVDDLVDEYGSLVDAIKAGKIPTDMFVKTLKKFLGIGEDVSSTTDDMTEKLEYFQDVVDKVWRGDYGNVDTGRYEKLTEAGYDYVAVQKLVNKTVDGHRLTLEDLVEVQSELSDEQLANIGYTEEQIEVIRDLAEQAEESGTPINELIESMGKSSGRDLLIDSFKNALEAILKPLRSVKSAWEATFSPITSEIIYKIIEKIHGLTQSLIISDDAAENFQKIFEGVFAGLQAASWWITGTLTTGLKLLKATLQLFGTDILTVGAHIADYIIKFRDWVEEHTIFIGVINKVAKVIQAVIEGVHGCVTEFVKLKKVQALITKIGDAIAKFFGKVEGGFDSINFDTIIEKIREFFEKIQNWIKGLDDSENLGKDIVAGLVKGIGIGIKGAVTAILNLAKSIFTAFCDFFGIASPSKVFIALGGFLIGGLIVGIANSESPLLSTLGEIATKCIDAVKSWYSTIWSNSSSFLSNIGSLFSSAEEDTSEGLTSIWSVVQKGIGKITSFLGSIEWGSLISTGFGVAMLVLAFKVVNILKILEGPLKAISGLIVTVSRTIGMLGNAIVGILKGIRFVFIAAGILILAVAIRQLAEALYTMSTIDKESVWRSVAVLGALIVALGLLAGIMIFLGKFGSKDAIFMTAPILAMAASLLIMAYAVKELSEVNPKRVISSLKLLGGMIIGLGALMTLFGIFCNIEMAGSMWQAGIMLLGAAAAMYILVKVIDLAGKLDASAVNNGLKVVAAVGVLFALLIKVGMRNSGRHAAQAGLMLIAISGAFLLMIGVIKVASWLNMADVKKGIKVLGVVGLLFTALIAVSNLAGEHAKKAGSMLLMVSVAMYIMLFIIKQAAGMEEAALKRGYTVVAGFAVLLGALIAVSKKAGPHAAQAGVMLLAASGALLIMTGILWLLTKFPDRSVLWESLGALSVMVGLLALLIGITKLAEQVKIGVLVTLVIAITIMTLAVYTLSLINEQDNMWPAVAALSALMVAFGILVAATKYATKVKVGDILPMIGVLIALAGVVYILAAIPDPSNVMPIVGALSALLIVFSAAMFIFSNVGSLIKGRDLLGPAAIMVGVILALGAIIWGLSTVPNPQTAIQMTATLIPLLLAFTGVTAALGLIGQGGNSVGNAAKGAAALAIVVGVVGALMVIIGTLLGLFSDEFFARIAIGLDRFVSMIEQVSLVLLAFTPVTFALSKFGSGSLAPAAEGAVALGAVILILGALAVAIGSLMQLFSDSFFTKIETGLDRFTSVMTKIGEAIGGFVGGVLGGIADGLLSGIGRGLSEFMSNAEIFIQGCGSIDESVLTGAGILAAAIILLSGAELANSFANLFGLGPGLPMLGLELTAFMVNAAGFILGASLIKPGSMEGIKTLSEAILILTSASLLDSIGKFFSFGSSPLVAFAGELGSLGEGLATFSSKLTEGGFTGDTVGLAENAAKVIGHLAGAAKDIPNSGGLLGAIMGNNDIGTWGEQLGDLGDGIANFLNALTGEDSNFTEESIGIAENAAKVIKLLAGAASEIPNSGGLLADIVGDNDMSKWAEELPNVASGVVGFLNALSDGKFTSDAVEVADDVADMIVTLAKASNEIPNSGGLLADIVGDNDFSKWGAGLADVGTGIAKFIGALTTAEGEAATMDFTIVEPAAAAIESLAKASKQIDGQSDWAAKIFGDDSLATFSENFGALGSGLNTFVSNLGVFDEDTRLTVEQAVAAVGAFATLADSNLKNAKSHLEDFGEKLSGFGSDITDFCDEMPSAKTIDTAITSLKDLLTQVKSVGNTDTSGMSGFADALKTAAVDGVGKFVEALTSDAAKTDVESAATKLANKAADGAGAKSVKTAMQNAGEALSDKGKSGIKNKTNYNDWASAGEYLGDGLVEGIEAKEDDVYDAAYALGQQAVQGEKDGQASNSPSKATIQAGHWFGEGLVIGIKRMFGQVYNTGHDMGETATNSISGAISRVADMVNTDIDAQPTIRPVMDLTDVETGVGAIGHMLDMDGSVGVLANAQGINSMMNRRIQNGSNDDVITAINKLGKSLGNIGGNSYTINGVTFEEGSDVADAFQTIVRAARLEGRV